jgi:hypothetical protein
MGQGRVKAVGFKPKETTHLAHRKEVTKRRLENKKKGIKSTNIPKTIENTRILEGTEIDENDDEIIGGDGIDEFQNVISGSTNPKVYISTTIEAGRLSCRFAQELQSVIPQSVYKRRRNWGMKKLIRFLKRTKYTSLIIVEQGVEKKRL